MLGAITAFMGFATLVSKRQLDSNDQLQFFVWFLLMFGTVFISTVYNGYGGSRKAIMTLTLPASHLEKFLVGWVYSMVLFPIIYIGCFYLADVFTLSLAKGNSDLINLADHDAAPEIFRVFFLLISISLLGAIYFTKVHFIKTAFVFFGGFIIILIVNHYLLKGLLPVEVVSNFPFKSFRVFEGHNMIEINLPKKIQTIFDMLLAGLCLPFWIAAYYKIKEKQV
jgi:hypothetical protein